jgi:beta-galactosidase
MTQPSLAQIADPLFFRENRLDAHSDHRWFRDTAEAAAGVSSFEQPLDGDWAFHYAARPADAPAGFEAPGFDRSGWATLPVPAHIQLHGYDRPQYVNVQYPWDGWEAIEAGQIPTEFNPVASYARTFTLDRPLAEGERLHVTFHGAESALTVWLNGHYVG